MSGSKVEPIYLRLAAKIVDGRKWFGITQEELAKRCGISRPSLANIEAGRQRVSLHDVEALAKAMGTEPEILMKGIW